VPTPDPIGEASAKDEGCQSAPGRAPWASLMLLIAGLWVARRRAA
jgi:uncharacterized protein (TIGR03382 family)